MTVSGESRGGGGPTRAFWFWAVESRAISGLCGCVSEGTREQAGTWDRRDTPRAAWGERGQDSDPNTEGQAAGRPDWGGGVKRRPLRSGRWRRGRVAADGGGLRKVSLYKGLSSFHPTIFARPVPTTTRLGARRARDPQTLQPRPQGWLSLGCLFPAPQSRGDDVWWVSPCPREGKAEKDPHGTRHCLHLAKPRCWGSVRLCLALTSTSLPFPGGCVGTPGTTHSPALTPTAPHCPKGRNPSAGLCRAIAESSRRAGP